MDKKDTFQKRKVGKKRFFSEEGGAVDKCVSMRFHIINMLTCTRQEKKCHHRPVLSLRGGIYIFAYNQKMRGVNLRYEDERESLINCKGKRQISNGKP